MIITVREININISKRRKLYKLYRRYYHFKRNSEFSFAVNHTHTYIEVTKHNLIVTYTCKNSI